jgi:DNA-binding transcriptional MerR regulator
MLGEAREFSVAKVTIAQAAAALGVSVDTVRRRIKAGLLRASRNEAGSYLVEVPDVAMHSNEPDAAESRPAPAAGATDQHLFKTSQRRATDYPHEIRALKELLELERKRNAELLEHVAFQRTQLENASHTRDRLLAILETQQQQFGIEQLQRIIGPSPSPERDHR